MAVSLLVALSEESSLLHVGRAMSAFGYGVETARSGIECLVRLRRQTPDILVLDRNLPWGGGEGILALLREHDDLRSLPVVLLTAESPDELPFEFLAPPVVRWIRKPLIPNVLQATLRSVERLL